MGFYGESVLTTDPAFSATSDDQTILGQWVTLAQLSPQGCEWTCPEYGVGLVQMVGKSYTSAELASEQARCSAAIEVDQRIASCDSTLTPTYLADGSVAIQLTQIITPKDTSVAPFTLTTLASASVVQTVLRGLS